MNKIMEVNSAEELFDSIDNIKNNSAENDLFIKKIENIFEGRLISGVDYESKEEKQNKKQEGLVDALEKYLVLLKELVRKTEKQIVILEKMLKKPCNIEMSEKIIELQKELDEYDAKKYNIEYSYVSKVLSKKECDIYENIKIYDFLDRYYNNIKEYKINTVDKSEQINVINSSNKWKTYYYLVICMKKQKDFNQTLLENYILRKKNLNEINLSVGKSSFLIADFQGQLSKSIFYQRKKLKLTQAELAQISGVDRSMIAKIETVNQPTTLETALKLLSALNISIAICPWGEK